MVYYDKCGRRIRRLLERRNDAPPAEVEQSQPDESGAEQADAANA